MAHQITIMKRMFELQKQLAITTHHTVELTIEAASSHERIARRLSEFDDFFRPIRNYFYWEPHCFDIPVCWSLRSRLRHPRRCRHAHGQDAGTPAVPGQDGRPAATTSPTDAAADRHHGIDAGHDANHACDHVRHHGCAQQQQPKRREMGQAYDAAKDDDSFYLPPEVFDNADFKRAMGSFISPDGKSVRFIISHKGDPATPEGIAASIRSGRPPRRRSRPRRWRMPRSI